MKKIYMICLTITAVLWALPMALSAQQVVELCQGASTSVMGGEYNIMNNVWGSGARDEDQCLEISPTSSYFKVSLSNHNSSGVASYPAIYKGCHWGTCTTKDNPMPIQVKEIGSAPFTWVINTENASGVWNAAFDIWFDDKSTFMNDYDAEMMIWFDYHGGASPAGSQQARVEIGGFTWEVYFAAWTSWNYIAYRATSPIDSATLDLRDFVHDSATRGYLYTRWYLHAIEAGFEIWRDGQGLTSHSFAADVTKTTSPVNYPPTSFRIQSPTDNRTLDSLRVTFKWQQTTDPDLDAVEYLLHILGPTTDTTVTGLTANSLDFDGREFFQPATTYTWYIEATDGIDTTRSTTQRAFNTRATLGVESTALAPGKFRLNQNYPNPFNPSTEIVFEIDKATHLELSVFNLLGIKVKTLRNGFHQPGEFRAVFDASELPAGLYYYQLETATQRLIRKCVYLK